MRKLQLEALYVGYLIYDRGGLCAFIALDGQGKRKVKGNKDYALRLCFSPEAL